jgi:MoxR-like ATPase
VDFLLSILVYGCKNVLLIGKPGTGKTSIARFIAEKLSFEPIVVTANAHWSRVDVIGGPMFIGLGSVTWRPGVLMEAIAKHLEAKQHGKRGAWLIIDEINRADVDKAFGEFFTIFSGPEPSEWVMPVYIIDEWERYSAGSQGDVYKKVLEAIKSSPRKSNAGYHVPPDFRVVGTMNYVDVANLFAIGEAFTRRFVRVVIDYPSNLDRELDILLNKVKRIKEFDDKVMSILDKDTLNTIKALTKELRDVKRLAFGSAYLLNTLYAFLAQVKLRLVAGEPVESVKREAKRILRLAVESSLSITPLWDEELKHDVDKALGKVLGSS